MLAQVAKLWLVARCGLFLELVASHGCLQAVDDSETALAVVQAKLLEAMKGQVALQGEVAAVKREAEHTRLRLEAEVGNTHPIHLTQCLGGE
jgi:hypothetical protein